MSNVIWLADVLRAAGLKVVEQPGWQQRGVGNMGEVRGIICHHTAGAKTGNAPSLMVVQNGRPDLRGPLSQLVLGRDGTFFVVAAGSCNHAGAGNWQGITQGNTQMIGIEAENAGVSSDPWPRVQYDAYVKGCAAILDHLDLGPSAVAGHKEYALPKGRKPDPTFDMNEFRANVGKVMGGVKPTVVVKPKPLPVPQKGVSDAMRLQMAQWIMFNETSKKPDEAIKVISPAVGDGGAFEVAGITEKHHPTTANQLKDLVESGQQAKAKQVLYDYYLAYTAFAANWTRAAGVEFSLRDSGIHRGPRGAAIILQKAVRVAEDGQVGPDTKEAMSRLSAEELIARIADARPVYEEEEYGHRAQFWNGFVNRWNRTEQWALEMQAQQNKLSPLPEMGGGGVVGVGAGWLSSFFTSNPLVVVGIGLVVAAIVYVAIRFLRRK